VSALALLLSWHKRKDGAARFYVRRLFRIAPMFWLAACMYLFIGGRASELSPLETIATFLFLNGWSPHALNALVPGGWSIAAEVMFYILFPFLVASITSLSAAALAFLAAVAFAILASYGARMLLATDDNAAFFLQWWFVAQAPVFLVGFIIYHASRIELPRWAWSLGVQASIVLLLFLVLVQKWLPGPTQVHFALAFGLLTLCLGKCAEDSMVNPIIEHIGRVSYSAYFWHFAILGLYASIGLPVSIIAHSSTAQFFALYIIVVLLSIALSTITYLAIEKPMIRFGGRIALRYFLAHEPVVATRSA
jgi:peptidoglycan/LPS O-acetylase OafA/YrhL